MDTPRFIDPGIARWASALLGAWLLVSAFLWPHHLPSKVNTWGVGVLICASAMIAPSVRSFRVVNTALAVWLLISTLALDHATNATRLSNGVVAVLALLTVSLGPRPR